MPFPGQSGTRLSLLASAATLFCAAIPAKAQVAAEPSSILHDIQMPAVPGQMPFKPMDQHIAPETSFPTPTFHSGASMGSPWTNYTSRWTRADARQIKALSSAKAPTGANSIPQNLTMPAIPASFPAISDKVWVWDTWPLTDQNGNQYSYNGWDVIFCLTAQKNAGFTFDNRHVHARIGYFYRKSGVPLALRPANGGWIYGGNVFADGASASVYKGQKYSTQAEWSGSARLQGDGYNGLNIFYTNMIFNTNVQETSFTALQATITKAYGFIHADTTHVWFTNFKNHIPLLKPDGVYYQTAEQNQYFNFRDPYTFTDPQHPGHTFMVFEGNSGSAYRWQGECTAADLGYSANDPNAETVAQVNHTGARFQRATIGLAVATNASLTAWQFLPPLISGNCVNDQTERPHVAISGNDYYLLTISHRTTFSAGIDGPDGEYAFYGHGLRSDWIPLNSGSGLMLGNPTDLNTAAGTPASPNKAQNPNAYQSYSHYYMPNGLVTSFIDGIGKVRGGTEAPTVQVLLSGPNSHINTAYGIGGLGGYGDISPNMADVDYNEMVSSMAAQSANLQTDASPALTAGLNAAASSTDHGAIEQAATDFLTNTPAQTSN